jgi:hypothetical protein
LSSAGDPRAHFEAFCALIVEDPLLLEALCGQRDVERLAVRAIELGRERGLVFGAREVRAGWLSAGASLREGR